VSTILIQLLKNAGTVVTAGYGIGWIIGMFVLVEEKVFIKPNRTRMTLIARIRADLGG
jgi:hypothetical protein